jgi:hypothetical protein
MEDTKGKSVLEQIQENKEYQVLTKEKILEALECLASKKPYREHKVFTSWYDAKVIKDTSEDNAIGGAMRSLMTEKALNLVMLAIEVGIEFKLRIEGDVVAASIDLSNESLWMNYETKTKLDEYLKEIKR